MKKHTCFVCDGELNAIGKKNSVEQLFELWYPTKFSDQVIEEHRVQALETQLYRCAKCSLEVFLPQIIGTPSFYVEAYNLSGMQAKASFTYSESKWDFYEASLDITGCNSLLEVGCGPGHFLSMVRDAVSKVYGVEYNEPAKVQARAKGLSVFSNVSEVDHAEGFDAVFCFHVLEHVKDPVEFVRELFSLVKPGGTVGISVPNQAGPIQYIDPCVMNMPPHHATRWNQSSLTALAFSLGVKIERFAFEPLLLENHSYYSIGWVNHALSGSSIFSSILRKVTSMILKVLFRFLRIIGLQYFNLLKGQSIYVRFTRPLSEGGPE